MICYCFGTENLDRIRKLGAGAVGELHLAHEKPIVNFTGQADRNCHSKGRINWGLNFWHHKIMAIEMAVAEHGPVVWLDWDVWQVAALPGDFWRALASGPPLQAALRVYRRPQCHWRRRHLDPGARYHVPHGAFLYCRSLEAIQRVAEIHRQDHPTQTDEIAMARYFDEVDSGWVGATVHQGLRDPGVYDMRKKYAYPPPARPIFQNRGKY
ncbi:hypothetical protein HQ590_14915 [bacterium]|nr:hypothetical protein [bacterium]